MWSLSSDNRICNDSMGVNIREAYQTKEDDTCSGSSDTEGPKSRMQIRAYGIVSVRLCFVATVGVLLFLNKIKGIL